MSAVNPIRIQGLKEFQRALKDMDGESQKLLRVVLNDVARTVATGAGRRVPRQTGRAAASLREQSSQREARVVGGSRKVPYYGWLDFGGRVGRDRAVRRPFIKAGRYMYPTLGANKESLGKALQHGLAQLARDAGVGLEVSE